MMRLWRVQVERRIDFEMVVVAGNEKEARQVASMYASDAEEDYSWDSPFDIGFPSEIQSADDLKEGERDWGPYGDDEGLNCAEWFRRRNDPQPVEHLAPFCGGTWRLSDPWIICDNCRAHVQATLVNLDAAWAENARGKVVPA